MTHARVLFFKTLALLLALAFIAPGAYPVRGQSEITLEDAGAEFEFGRTITFHAKIKAPQAIQSVTLLIYCEGQDAMQAIKDLPFNSEGAVVAAYDVSTNPFPPFGKISFWFKVMLADGQVYDSDKNQFTYDDKRFNWIEETNPELNVAVHWHAGDAAFGARALNAAAQGAAAAGGLIEISYAEPIDVYVYAEVTDLQSTMMLNGKPWVGGHAIPGIGVALAALPPNADPAEFDTKIPHELMHVLLYRALGAKYKLQPVWLLEGLASMAERYPNPEYKRALDAASAKDALIPFEKLCLSFPPDAGSAYLAYAQSASFMGYLYKRYGKSDLTLLMNEYGDGVDCEMGATRALGTPLSQLDLLWREDVLGQNVTGAAIRNLAPFMALMALVLVVPLWGMIDLLRQRRKREEKYAPKPSFK